MTTPTSVDAAARGVSTRVLAAAIVGLLAGPPIHLAAPAAREVLLVGVLTVGAAIDLRTRRVPNWATAGGGAFALASAPGDGAMLLGGLTALLCGVGIAWAARGAYGMGDVKAMGVAGATVGLGGVPLFLCWMALAGGVGVALLAVRTRGLRGHTLPYAPAIAAGCALALLLR